MVIDVHVYIIVQVRYEVLNMLVVYRVQDGMLTWYVLKIAVLCLTLTSTLLSSAFSQSILIKHIYRHPMREAELHAAREGRSVDNVEVDEEKAREDFLVFFE